MDSTLATRVSACLGRRIISAHPIQRGYTPAARYTVTLEGGGSAFVKAATASHVARWLRAEHAIYQAVQADFMPALLGWDDDGETPILILEDLSGAHWPPPWAPAQIEAVRAVLGRLADMPVPAHVPGVVESHGEDLTSGWRSVAEDPAAILGLGICSQDWLARSLPMLRDAESTAPIGGDDFLHLDVRSDNICLLGDRAILVDWNWACRGNRALDLAAWAPSLHLEGGPPPEEMVPDAGPLAAAISGFFASRAGLPIIPTAPRVREVQRAQLGAALPWAARALGLPAPDGRSMSQ